MLRIDDSSFINQGPSSNQPPINKSSVLRRLIFRLMLLSLFLLTVALGILLVIVVGAANSTSVWDSLNIAINLPFLVLICLIAFTLARLISGSRITKVKLAMLVVGYSVMLVYPGIPLARLLSHTFGGGPKKEMKQFAARASFDVYLPKNLDTRRFDPMGSRNFGYISMAGGIVVPHVGVNSLRSTVVPLDAKFFYVDRTSAQAILIFNKNDLPDRFGGCSPAEVKEISDYYRYRPEDFIRCIKVLTTPKGRDVYAMVGVNESKAYVVDIGGSRIAFKLSNETNIFDYDAVGSNSISGNKLKDISGVIRFTDSLEKKDLGSLLFSDTDGHKYFLD
jgi:hypothetical protein